MKDESKSLRNVGVAFLFSLSIFGSSSALQQNNETFCEVVREGCADSFRFVFIPTLKKVLVERCIEKENCPVEPPDDDDFGDAFEDFRDDNF